MEVFKKLADIQIIPDLVTSIRQRAEKFLPCSSKSKKQMNYEKVHLKYFTNFYLARTELYIVIVEVFKRVQQIERNKSQISLVRKQFENTLSKFSFKDYYKVNKQSDDETEKIKICIELIKNNSKAECLEKISFDNLQFSFRGNLRENAIELLISNALEDTVLIELEALLKALKNEELFSKFEILKYSKCGLTVAHGNIESIILVMQELETFLKVIAQKNRKHIKGHMYKELMSKFKIMYEYQALYVDISYLNDIFILIHKFINEIYVSLKK